MHEYCDSGVDAESGFSLVELLVVIVIIGILSAIAIGAFMTQRQKANDAAVESDARNVVMAIETALIDEPNATNIQGVATERKKDIRITIEGNETHEIFVDLSEDVGISAVGNSNRYVVFGSHSNGHKYTDRAYMGTRLVYVSTEGVFRS